MNGVTLVRAEIAMELAANSKHLSSEKTPTLEELSDIAENLRLQADRIDNLVKFVVENN